MAIAHVVNRAEGAPSGGGGFTFGTAIDTTGANFIALVVSYYSSSGAPAVSDSKSNTWTPRTVYDVGATGAAIRLYYAVNPTVGTGHTFTQSTANFSSMWAAAFSGVDTSSPFDTEAGNTETTGSTIQAGSVTPAVNDCLVLSILGFGTGDLPTINGGFTLADFVAFNGSAHEGIRGAYLIQTTAAAANPTWDKGVSEIRGAATNAVFAPAAAGGGGNPWYYYAQQRSRPKVSRDWHKRGLLWTPSYAMRAA